MVAALCTLIGAIMAVAPAAHAAVSFGKSALKGTSSSNPTSLQFGPDGRLYVAQQNGLIKAYTVARAGANSYQVKTTETIGHIQSMPNRNDLGVLEPGVKGRLVTGLLVTGTASTPVIYVGSSDPRIGAGPSGGDLNLDTNSGIISKLVRSGSGWIKTDLVRGLPRSEENHGPNGMALSPDGSTLYVAEGGNTNKGAPSHNFAGLPEYALSAAILSIDLDAVPYDLPTLDAPNDANDPFGGDDGRNQAKLVDGPVKVHAPGFRNAYDVLVTQAGKMYSIDNGGNGGWGDVPVGEGPHGKCTNQLNDPGTTERDSLHHITGAGYYGGHPNPTRGNKANVFDGQSPIGAANPIECDFQSAGAADGSGKTESSLVSFGASTNGLTEYTASNFGGAMKGDLIAASLDNTIQRLALGAGGTTATKSALASNATSGGHPLDITALGDDGPFPGTLWYGGWSDGGIYVLEPGDFGGVKPITCDPDKPDSDADGYANGDEKAAGTDPCSAADKPADFDGDLTSDVTDANDDNDALADVIDPFARDGANGLKTSLPVSYQWENDAAPAGGLLNLGFTGLMTNGATDYLKQFSPEGMTTGGAAGVVTIDEVAEGDAYAGKNNQLYGFQFGINARPDLGRFTAHTRIVAPFNGLKPQDSQSMGLFIGTGSQDDYVKAVVGASAGTSVQRVSEIAGAPTSAKTPLTLPGPDYVDLYLAVDPATGTVQASYTATTKNVTSARVHVGAPVTVPAKWFTADTGLAVGIISTSAGPGPVFPASWDFISVSSDVAAPRLPVVAVTPSQPPATVARDTTRPVVSRLQLTPSRFRSVSLRRPRAGTRVSFHLSEAADVTLAVERRRTGRLRAGRCVLRRSASGSRRCVRHVRLDGALRARGRAGENRLRFDGRLGGRRLKPGRYRLVVRATDAAGNRSVVRRIPFRILS